MEDLDFFRVVERVTQRTPLAGMNLRFRLSVAEHSPATLAVKSWTGAISDPSKDLKPVELTVTLLSTLYNQVILSEASATRATYLGLKSLFEHTFRPYWRMIDRWIFEGIAGEGERDEFLVVRFPE